MVRQGVPPAPRPRGTGTFGGFGLLLLEPGLQLAGVIVEAFERLIQDPVLGLQGRVHVAHGAVELLVRDASLHVPASHKRTVKPRPPAAAGGAVRHPSLLRDALELRDRHKLHLPHGGSVRPFAPVPLGGLGVSRLVPMARGFAVTEATFDGRQRGRGREGRIKERNLTLLRACGLGRGLSCAGGPPETSGTWPPDPETHTHTHTLAHLDLCLCEDCGGTVPSHPPS